MSVTPGADAAGDHIALLAAEARTHRARTIPLTGWFPPHRSDLDRMTDGELLELAQVAEDMEIRARLAGDTYGQQVARERRGIAERAHCARRRAPDRDREKRQQRAPVTPQPCRWS